MKSITEHSLLLSYLYFGQID